MIYKGTSIKNLVRMPSPWGRSEVPTDYKSFTEYQASWVAAQLAFEKKTANELIRKYKVPRRTLFRWPKIIKSGKMVSLEQGRKNYLTQSDKEWLIQFLKPDSFNKSDQEFRDEVQALVDMNMDESGKPRVTISDRFLRDLENELVIKTGGAEETTDARAAAVADKLNSYTFAALSTLIAKIVHRGLICNADATQYTVGYDSKRKITGKYI